MGYCTVYLDSVIEFSVLVIELSEDKLCGRGCCQAEGKSEGGPLQKSSGVAFILLGLEQLEHLALETVSFLEV